MAVGETALPRTINQIAQNGIENNIELSSLVTAIGYVTPQEARAWTSEFHPELSTLVDALLTNPDLDLASIRRLPTSVTLGTTGPAAAPFREALLAIHGPKIDLRPASASPIGLLEARAIANAIGRDRLGAFLEASTQPGFGLKLNLTEAGLTQLGLEAGSARQPGDAERIARFRESLPDDAARAALDAGLRSASRRRVSTDIR